MKNVWKRFWGRCCVGVMAASMMMSGFPMTVAAAPSDSSSQYETPIVAEGTHYTCMYSLGGDSQEIVIDCSDVKESKDFGAIFNEIYQDKKVLNNGANTSVYFEKLSSTDFNISSDSLNILWQAVGLEAYNNAQTADVFHSLRLYLDDQVCVVYQSGNDIGECLYWSPAYVTEDGGNEIKNMLKLEDNTVYYPICGNMFGGTWTELTIPNSPYTASEYNLYAIDGNRFTKVDSAVSDGNSNSVVVKLQEAGYYVLLAGEVKEQKKYTISNSTADYDGIERSFMTITMYPDSNDEACALLTQIPQDEDFNPEADSTYIIIEYGDDGRTALEFTELDFQSFMDALSFPVQEENDRMRTLSMMNGWATIIYTDYNAKRDFSYMDLYDTAITESDAYGQLSSYFSEKELSEMVLLKADGQGCEAYVGYTYSYAVAGDYENNQPVYLYYYLPSMYGDTFAQVGTYDAVKGEEGAYAHVFAERPGEYIVTAQELPEALLYSGPNIFDRITEYYVNEGESVSLSLAISDTSVLDSNSLRWQKQESDGTWSTVSIGYSYDFVATAADDGSVYRFVYSDVFGNDYTFDVTVYVEATLKITKNPVDTVVSAGMPASFKVVAEGNGLKYRWQFQNPGEKTWSNSSISAAYKDTFQFTANEKLNGRLYRCVVTDEYGNSVTSQPATLTVYAKPKIVNQPVDIEASVGDTVSFTVKATGDGLKYQWQYKNANATKWSNSNVSVAKTNSMTFKVTTDIFLDGRQYRCIVSDSHGVLVTSEPATLTVKAGLAITGQPKDVTAKAGEKVSFKVTATGTNLTYQWQYKNANATNWLSSGIKAAKTDTMTFAVGTDSFFNGRQYRCIVKDQSGNTVTSSIATLTVEEALKIVKQPTSVVATENETVHYIVEATGENLKYQWQYQLRGSNTWSNSGIVAAKTKDMTFTANASCDGRKYRCVITNASGQQVITDAVSLSVVKKITITGQPTDVTVAAGATASFKVAATGDGLTYQWEYKNANSNTWAASSVSAAKTTTMSFKASTSLNGRQYRCKITDKNGSVVYSNVATLTVQ